MKGHASKFLLRSAWLAAFLLASVLVWHFGWPLIRRIQGLELLVRPRISDSTDAKQLLATANYFYWRHNFPKSTPLYKRAEELATHAHDEHDPLLRLWCLGVKGGADDELNVAAARQDWEEALNLAQQLGQREWANRARGGVW